MDSVLVISCHDADVDAKWVTTNRGIRCNVCESVHPDEFIRALKAFELRHAWLWSVAEEPLIAQLTQGVFFAEHLKDMSVDWLYENAALIFERTGVLFYWRKEHLCFGARATWNPYGLKG